MTTVYLIRHGAYENPKQIFHGRLPGFPLSAQGKVMAQETAKVLKDKPIVAVYSSRLTRAYETARIIAKHHRLPVVVHRLLLDIRTPLQGKPLSYTKTVDGNFYQPRFIRAGAEDLPDVYGRMSSFLRVVVKRHAGEHIVAVTHGDLLMTTYDRFSNRAWPAHGYSFKNWYVPQATGFKVEFDDAASPLRIAKFPA